MSAAPRTAKGERTRRALLDAAEAIFATHGYSDASIVRITERAGVGQGTFYLYFDSKLQIFEELVDDLNRRVRHAMTERATESMTRIEREREGFRGFFRFTAEHPALYRIVREAEFVSPRSLRLHYTRIVDGYIDGLESARDRGEIGDIDPTVAAWALMGVGEMIGMRWVLWGGQGEPGDAADPLASGTAEIPDEVFDQMMQFIENALRAQRPEISTAEPVTTSDQKGS